jgi:sarcosine oxidase subunit alpha
MRLDALPTLHINPLESRSLRFNGKTYHGVAGDTVATALFANGVRIFGRSLKYHRPRGLYSLDGECSNTLMAVDGVPNVRAENTPLKNGMSAAAQNVMGSAEFDWMGFMGRLDWLMPAGFYYRTLHKPAWLWPPAMKLVRKAAGLGRIAPDFRMKGVFSEIYPSADVCVIGGGPAGMSAALAAAESGLRVVLLEARPWLGGSFDYRVSAYDGKGALFERARSLAAQVDAAESIRVFRHAACVGVYNNNLVTAFQAGSEGGAFDERYIEIRAGSVVAATGCIERPLLFENNERPGVMQVGCAHRLARTYGLLPGRRAVFSIGHDLGLEAAVDLCDLGLQIACVVDIREDGQDPDLLLALAERRVPYLKGWVATKAHGGRQVKKATLSTIEGSATRRFDCDLLVASAGLTPVTGPLTLAQAQLRYDAHTGYFLPADLPPAMHAAGSLTGRNHPQAIEASGRLAGLKAAADCGVDTARAAAEASARLGELPGPARGTKLVAAPVNGRKSFICFDEDTTVKNVKQAIAMGFDVPELIKRFTSAGTGPGQGGIPGHNLPLFAARHQALAGATPVPTTTRAPLVPTLVATYAGAHHDMCKRTPLDPLQKREGGIFRRIGVWQRARYFSADFGCREEVLNVRNNVGMLDGSTLGKFRLHGPDALKALERVYVGNMARMTPGKIKYSAMCNEDGCVIDDGVVVKIAENHYYFTTSTARAGETAEWFRYHTRYDGWDYHIVNLTDALGVVNISGPNARKVLQKVADADLTNEAFPFGGYREFTIKGAIPVRAMRLGFVGELSYELHAPSSYMISLWEILAAAGKEFGIRNFGVEAQNALRMEKCHIILGVESEQRTNLLDLGLGFLWDRKKTDAKTVGAPALRQAEADPNRLRLAGIEMEDPERPPRDGALIVDKRVRGYVCTARRSATLNRSIGLALVEAELAAVGNRVEIFEDECQGKKLAARIAPMPFYDPQGLRMRM